MAIREVKGEVLDLIPVQTVLVSVFDKTGLENLIPGLLSMNPMLKILSTGGTYTKLRSMLGISRNLEEVSVYTGTPEMEGGLVKTLDPKIHAGILGERTNPAHIEYLNRIGASFIDMVVVNLYPFESVIAKDGVTFEQARGNIDIGGPTMLRGAAKNFLGCAPVCDPSDYDSLLRKVNSYVGGTILAMRFDLAKKAFEQTERYERTIDRFMLKQDWNTVKGQYLN